MTLPRRDLRHFLGRKNFKGIYSKNPLATTPAYHNFDKRKSFLTSYKVRPFQRQGPFVNWKTVFDKENAQSSRRPFEHNEFAKSNDRVGPALREAILRDHKAGETAQRISFKYGISVLRIEAVIRLNSVKAELTKSGKITKEMAKFAKHMNSLFFEIPTTPAGQPRWQVDNLTEIPIPKEVRMQRFLSIAESEPFGPVDAAEVLGIEPAAKTLQKLTEIADEPEAADSPAQAQANAAARPISFLAPQLEGDRSRFRFTDAKVGNVGYRYGAARDDRKHARRVRFLPNGNMTYPEPEHS